MGTGAVRRLASLTAIAALVLGSAAVASAQEAQPIAVLPFENVSGSISGSRIIMPIIERALADRGYRVVDADALERWLFANRIRNTGRLGSVHAARLRQSLNVDIAMVGSVALYNDSSENPQWGLSARLVSTRDGRIVWTAEAGVTGADFASVLGLGMITSGQQLGHEAVKKLLRDLPRSGHPLSAPTARPATRARFFGFRAAYRSDRLESDPPKRVAVLPFENLSERRGAARIVTDLFTNALFEHGRFEVIEPGSVDDALAATDVTPFGAIDLDALAALGKSLGADAVVIGTVHNYNEGIKRGSTSPEVALDARMLETSTGRILWLATNSKTGEDSQIAFEFGRIRSMIPLALKTVREMARTI